MALTKTQPIPGKRCEVVYLQSRKPEVPSGPLGWRITWLFGRPASDGGGCEFKRAGLAAGDTDKAFLLKGTLLMHRWHRHPSSTRRWRFTCPGPDCPEARRPKKRCPESSCVLRRTRPRAAPKSWCAGRAGTRTPLSPPCRCWRDVSRFESAAAGRRAESRLGSRWRCE